MPEQQYVYRPDSLGHQEWAGKRVESIDSSTCGRLHAVQLSEAEFAGSDSLVLVVAAFDHELEQVPGVEIVNAEGWTEL